jgi:hypothetical protein
VSFEAIKEQVDLLADAERRRLMAYLVSVEHARTAEHAERMRKKIECNDPARWLTLEQVEERLRLNDGSA